MSKREVIAYAITHAPPGVKGGPYEADRAAYGSGTPQLSAAARWTFRPVVALGLVRRSIPHARVIRIVRKARHSEAEPTLEIARRRLAAVAEHMTERLPGDGERARGGRVPRGPSEVSAVEVLRELVAAFHLAPEDRANTLFAVASKAYSVLAASGPDPSEVVRTAMAWSEATAANGAARTVALQLACVAHRKAGGKVR